MEVEAGDMIWIGSLGLPFILLMRIVIVLRLTGRPLPHFHKPRRALKTLIVLGSGGHTAEMLNVVKILDFEKYFPRFYVAAMTDRMSIAKAQQAEEDLLKNYTQGGGKLQQVASYLYIYRSREVLQSYITSVITTLMALVHAMWIVLWIRPDVWVIFKQPAAFRSMFWRVDRVFYSKAPYFQKHSLEEEIICNGPGTCLPVCTAALILKILGAKWVVMVYVESIARVKKLSLTGLLFYKLHMMDQFYVQWPKLQQLFPRTQYLGKLM